MPGKRAYLRVASPPNRWGYWTDAADAQVGLAEISADRLAWSLYLGDTDQFPKLMLGAFYGWREGVGPLHIVGYLPFELSELTLTGGTLAHTPQNYTNRWPAELADAHHDLDGHTAEGVRALADRVGFDRRLVQVSRQDCYVEQVRLAVRPDCPKEFRNRLVTRLRKLARQEAPLHDATRAACAAAGLTVPDPVP